jgi:hypothetical protein
MSRGIKDYMKWAELASEGIIKKTSEALRARGVLVEFLQKRRSIEKVKWSLFPGRSKHWQLCNFAGNGFVDLLKRQPSMEQPQSNSQKRILKTNGLRKKAPQQNISWEWSCSSQAGE